MKIIRVCPENEQIIASDSNQREIDAKGQLKYLLGGRNGSVDPAQDKDEIEELKAIISEGEKMIKKLQKEKPTEILEKELISEKKSVFKTIFSRK